MPDYHTVPKKDRVRGREYPDQKPISTPVTFKGKNLYPDDAKRLLQELRLSTYEDEYVETFEEANDFAIESAEEDGDFFVDLTVYEMHEIKAEANELVEEATPRVAAESNETEVRASDNSPAHDQSAPDEPTRS